MARKVDKAYQMLVSLEEKRRIEEALGIVMRHHCDRLKKGEAMQVSLNLMRDELRELIGLDKAVRFESGGVRLVVSN